MNSWNGFVWLKSESKWCHFLHLFSTFPWQESFKFWFLCSSTRCNCTSENFSILILNGLIWITKMNKWSFHIMLKYMYYVNSACITLKGHKLPSPHCSATSGMTTHTHHISQMCSAARLHIVKVQSMWSEGAQLCFGFEGSIVLWLLLPET